MKQKIRLIAAQGPAQILNIIALLGYLNSLASGTRAVDILVLGGLGPLSDNRIVDSILLVAEIWSFDKIVVIDEFNAPFFGLARLQSSAFRSQIGIQNVDELFVCRNWQPFNETLIRAFPLASIICYGDGSGILDIKLNPKRNRQQPHFSIPDKIYLHIPIVLNKLISHSFLSDRFERPPLKFLRAAILGYEELARTFTKECLALVGEHDGDFALVTTSSLTESGYMWVSPICGLLMFILRVVKKFSFYLPKALKLYVDKGCECVLLPIRDSQVRREVDLYCDHLLAHVNPNSAVIVKPHPREVFNQAALLVDRLNTAGHNAFVVPSRYKFLPIEILLRPHLGINKIFCLGSQSAITILLSGSAVGAQLYFSWDVNLVVKARFSPADAILPSIIFWLAYHLLHHPHDCTPRFVSNAAGVSARQSISSIVIKPINI